MVIIGAEEKGREIRSSAFQDVGIKTSGDQVLNK